MSTTRTFFAIPISPAIQRRVADLLPRLRAVGGKIKWVEPAQLHLTLNFLGDVERDQLAGLHAAARAAAASAAPFALSLRGLGAFPNERAPRVVWLGVEQGADALIRLHQALASAFAPLGFAPEERAYTPHLTLGRVKFGPAPGLPALLRGLAAFEAGGQTVDAFEALSSELAPAGPEYATQAVFRLGP